MQSDIIAILFSYLFASIPFGLILTKIFSKKDIRKSGSGNIGATNVVRAVGKKLGYATFILDAFKGIIAIIFASYLQIESSITYNLVIIASVIGHCFPIFLKFKGGKAVATIFGIVALTDFQALIAVAFGWYILFYISKMVSFASIISLIVIMTYNIITFHDISYAIIFICLISIFKHQGNIRRIANGEEFSFKEKTNKKKNVKKSKK